MRNHPLFVFALSTLWTAAVLMLPYTRVPVQAAQQAQRVLGRKAYRSLDHTLVATVVTLKQQASDGENPSRVEVRNAGRHLLASRDHSIWPDEGYTVRKVAWTADARFFVYQVSNSGGHSPWHGPVFFYSRKKNQFYSLEHALASFGHGPGSITGDLKLSPPCTIFTKGRYYAKSRQGLRTSIERGDQSGEKLLEIDLRWLESHLTRSAVSSDDNDRREEQRQ
jgi:hypothetical protein